MHKFSGKRTMLTALVFLAAVIAAGYWFFAKTIRGNSLALYLAAGWGAPIHTRINCARETDAKVYDKFQRPLAFDEQSKDLLKNFWFYSYYRGCLFRNGFDFYGKKVAKSEISGIVYTNSYAHLKLSLPAGYQIIQDNLLDVDLDDRLFSSKISAAGNLININYYQKQDDYGSIESLQSKLKKIPDTAGAITDTKLIDALGGFQILEFSQSDGLFGLAFFNKQDLFIIFGPESLRQTIEKIGQSASFTN